MASSDDHLITNAAIMLQLNHLAGQLKLISDDIQGFKSRLTSLEAHAATLDSDSVHSDYSFSDSEMLQTDDNFITVGSRQKRSRPPTPITPTNSIPVGNTFSVLSDILPEPVNNFYPDFPPIRRIITSKTSRPNSSASKKRARISSKSPKGASPVPSTSTGVPTSHSSAPVAPASGVPTFPPTSVPPTSGAPTSGAPTSATAAPSSQAVKEPRAPPIVLREISNWMTILKEIHLHRINFLSAHTTNDSIRIIPASVDDFRKLIKLFDDKHYVYHKYPLAEEKTLKIVLRGIPVQIATDHISSDLIDQGITPIKVARMTGRNKAPMPLVFVEVNRDQKQIFSIKHVCSLSVRIETLRRPSDISQCHRCQTFRHSQKNCRAHPKCVKCAGEHLSADCPKRPDARLKCANCGGEHTASYKGCPKFPKRPTKPARPANSQPKPSVSSPRTNPSTSYAQSAATNLPQTSRRQDSQLVDVLSELISAIRHASNGEDAVNKLSSRLPQLYASWRK